MVKVLKAATLTSLLSSFSPFWKMDYREDAFFILRASSKEHSQLISIK